MKLSTCEDLPTWNDSIVSALTYAQVRPYIGLPPSPCTIALHNDPRGSIGSAVIPAPAPRLTRLSINSSKEASGRPSSLPFAPTIVIYTTAATLYAALIRDFGKLDQETPRSAPLLRPSTLGTPMLPTWLRTLGSLARDLTAMGLTVNKLLYALYLRGLPPGLPLQSPLSCLLPSICLTPNLAPMTCRLLFSSLMPMGSVGAKAQGFEERWFVTPTCGSRHAL